MSEHNWGQGFWSAVERDDGWIEFTDWKVPKNYSARKKAFREWKRVEREMAQQKTVKGWLAGCAIENYKMIRLFDSVGAKEYCVHEGDLVFFKEIKHDDQKEETIPSSNTNPGRSDTV